MRVLLWSSIFWPHVGGVEVLGAHFVGALRRRGHEVIVVTGYVDGESPSYEEIDGVPVWRVGLRRALEQGDVRGVAAGRRRMMEIREDFAPDLEHVFHPGPEDALTMSLRAQRPVPSVLSVHMNPNDFAPRPMNVIADLIRASDWTVACSRSILDEIRRLVPEVESCSAIVNALPPPAGELPPPPDRPVLAMVGRLDPQKGFDLALSAIASLRRNHPRLTAVVAGRGSEELALRQQASELGLGPDIVDFRGWVDPAEVPAVIAASTMVVMPSRFEPFGLVALQAAQVGRALVGANVDGLPEVVADDETGVLVAPEDPGALATAIDGLLRDPDRCRRLGAEGRRRALAGDDWDRHVSEYEELYERLLRG